MRQFLVLVLILAFLGSAYAFELGNQRNLAKNSSHVDPNSGLPNSRQGGEDMESAVPILSLPFYDTGNTLGHQNDYDAICPYDGSTAPDLVYSFFPDQDIVLSVDLCGSSYDTKTYIFEGSGNLIFCNDDFYYNDPDCGNYTSKIEDAYLTGGQKYYIVIDGYGDAAGEYILEINEFIPPPPCIIDCYDHEGEPELVDGYEDNFNGGCNSPDFGSPFDYFQGNYYGAVLDYCGQSGWYTSSNGGLQRDTDWYIADVGVFGLVEWTLDAEQETYGFLLGPNDCSSVAVVDQILVGPCEPQTMTIQGTPGSILWLWIGPSTFEAPGGFIGHEYTYICNFTGLMVETVSTEKITFDGIKSLYR